MKRTLILVAAGFVLISCGVDGAPTPPQITGFTKVGVASGAGIVTDTDISIVLSSN